MPLIRKISLLAIFISATLLYYHLTTRAPTIATTNMGSASDKPIRLAILLNDTPQPKTLARVGNYKAVFSELLTAACAPESLESQLTITSHDVVNDLDSYPALEDVDALLLTGSKHTAFEDDPWILKLVEYTKKALDSGRVKVIGVCFGQQIVGRALGAPLGRSDKGWEVAVTESKLTEKGKEIFQMEKMRIHQMHRDIVFEFPKDAIPLASNDICTVQAMYSPGKYIAVQGHPEFTEALISEVLAIRHGQGIFSDEIYEDAMKRAGIEHDGVAIARGFLRFLKSG